MKNQAIGAFVIIKEEKQEAKKIGALEIESKVDDKVRFITGEVVSCGEKILNLKKGDRVKFDKTSGHGVILDGEDYRVMTVGGIAIIL